MPVHTYLQTLGVGARKLIRLGKEVPEMYVAFCFGAKLTSLGATNQIAQAKF